MKIESNSWNDAILIETSVISDAIKTLNKGSLKIVLVVNTQGKLLGTISDGDIRRGILSGLTLDDSIEKIVNFDSTKVTEDVEKNDFNHKNNVVASRNFSPKNAQKNCGKAVRVHFV